MATTKNVLVVVATKPQVFALGTVEGLFKYELKNVDAGDFVVSQAETSQTNVIFPLVPVGSYKMTVTKNGVSVTQAFVIEATEVTINVPDTLTITFE
jgi:hypothetical protein